MKNRAILFLCMICIECLFFQNVKNINYEISLRRVRVLEPISIGKALQVSSTGSSLSMLVKSGEAEIGTLIIRRKQFSGMNLSVVYDSNIDKTIVSYQKGFWDSITGESRIVRDISFQLDGRHIQGYSFDSNSNVLNCYVTSELRNRIIREFSVAGFYIAYIEDINGRRTTTVTNLIFR